MLGSCRSSDVEQQNREAMGRGGKRKKTEKEGNGGEKMLSEAAACPMYEQWNTGGMQTNQQSKVKKQENRTC